MRNLTLRQLRALEAIGSTPRDIIAVLQNLRVAGALEAFDGLGTPAAYLLDEAGNVAAPIAMGASHVPALAREAAAVGDPYLRLPGEKALAESRIERTGLKAGTVAPSFTLPRLDGKGDLSLSELRGKRVLLVFSSPGCGPCNALAPELEKFHRENSAADRLSRSPSAHRSNRAGPRKLPRSFGVVRSGLNRGGDRVRADIAASQSHCRRRPPHCRGAYGLACGQRLLAPIPIRQERL